MKVLIVIDNLHIGGVASSLYNFLNYASKKMDCHLLVFNEKSIRKEELPANIMVVKGSRLLHVLGQNRSELMRESMLLSLYKGFLIAICKMTNGEWARKLLFLFIGKIGGYDLAISYAQDDSWKSISKGCNDYVLSKVKAKYKAAVIHCDYQNFGGYNQKQEKSLSRFDTILCVSESCKESFSKCFPTLRNKAVACENFINVDKVQFLAKNAVEYPEKSINFVTVCRLSVVKGLERTINVLREFNNNGSQNFTWTIVGDGPEFDNLKEHIKKSGLTEKIKLVGSKNNPYTYMKNASFFLLPSFHEAAPMVYGESVALGVPIFTTDTCSARELVEEKGWGIVVDNSEQGIREGLMQIFVEKKRHLTHIGSETEINKNALYQWSGFIELVKAKLNEDQLGESNENK